MSYTLADQRSEFWGHMVSAECEPVMGLWDRAPSGVPTEGRAPGQGALRLLFWGNKGAFTY